MPLTQFHVGPGLLLGLLAIRYLDLPTVLLASVIVDWRAGLVVLGLWPGPRHWWMHTFLGGLAFVLAVVVPATVLLRPRIDGALRDLELGREWSPRSVTAGAVVGVAVHVAIDATHHPRMEPFWPLGGNPLYGTATTFEMRVLTAACLLVGLALLLAHLGDVVALGRRSGIDRP